jgi:hypothetical protein
MDNGSHPRTKPVAPPDCCRQKLTFRGSGRVQDDGHAARHEPEMGRPGSRAKRHDRALRLPPCGTFAPAAMDAGKDGLENAAFRPRAGCINPRCSPPKCIGAIKQTIRGNPDPAVIRCIASSVPANGTGASHDARRDSWESFLGKILGIAGEICEEGVGPDSARRRAASTVTFDLRETTCQPNHRYPGRPSRSSCSRA